MKSLVGANWCEACDGSVIEVRNPATNEFLDTVPSLSVDEVNCAVDYSFSAQIDWKSIAIYERCLVMHRFISLINANKDVLAKTLSDETGMSIKCAYNEINNVKIGVSSYVELVKHDYGDVIPNGIKKGYENIIQYTIKEPLGVCVINILFNSFSNIFVNRVIPALLMGNSVILKPDSMSSLTATKFVKLLVEAGILSGVISILHGIDSVIIKALLSNEKVSFVNLGGLSEVDIGNCSNYLGRVSLELCGSNTFILCEDGDIDLAVDETLLGSFYNAGQEYGSSKRFLIHNSIKQKYIDKLIEKIQMLKVGYPSDDETDIGCLSSEETAILVEEQVNKTIEQGAKLVYGGRRNGAFYEPTILDGVTRDMDVSKNMEIFGPVVLIIGFDFIEEAIDIANLSKKLLSASIVSRDVSLGISISEKLECNGFIINGAAFFGEGEKTFLGCKYSGIGYDFGINSLRRMSKTKSVILKNIIK